MRRKLSVRPLNSNQAEGRVGRGADLRLRALSVEIFGATQQQRLRGKLDSARCA
jgi:hypothetical protein